MQGLYSFLPGYQTNLSASLSFKASITHILQKHTGRRSVSLERSLEALLATTLLDSSEKVVSHSLGVLDNLAWGGNPGWLLPSRSVGLASCSYLQGASTPSLVHTLLVLSEPSCPWVGFQLLTRCSGFRTSSQEQVAVATFL